jgi:hypothetical protein
VESSATVERMEGRTERLSNGRAEGLSDIKQKGLIDEGFCDGKTEGFRDLE